MKNGKIILSLKWSHKEFFTLNLKNGYLFILNEFPISHLASVYNEDYLKRPPN